MHRSECNRELGVNNILKCTSFRIFLDYLAGYMTDIDRLMMDCSRITCSSLYPLFISVDSVRYLYNMNQYKTFICCEHLVLKISTFSNCLSLDCLCCSYCGHTGCRPTSTDLFSRHIVDFRIAQRYCCNEMKMDETYTNEGTVVCITVLSIFH